MTKKFSQQDADRMLIGATDSPKHLSGIRRDDQVTDLYLPDPKSWPVKDGQMVPQVNWGGLTLPMAASNLHFMIAGLPGTGKTISVRMLIQSVFDSSLRENIGGTDRAVIYDPKQEFFPILRGLGVQEEDIYILNPFDRRSWYWDIAADYTNMAGAGQLAKTIIPCNDNLSQPFFPKAAAAVLSAVIGVHMEMNPGQWDLADVVFDCLTEDRILSRLTNAKVTPYNVAALNSLAKGDTRASVIAELTTELLKYLPLASCWRTARRYGRGFTIKRFLQEQGKIAILGANATYSEVLAPMNRLFLRRFSEQTLDNTSDSRWQAKDRTWLILDEVRELGKVHDLGTFIAKGRSKGLCTVIGIQDFPGLKEAFGENVAQEIVNCCKHRLFMKLQGESADWASSCIGKTEVMDVSIAVQTGSTTTASFSSGKADTVTTNTVDWWGSTRNTPLGSISTSKQSGVQISSTSSANVTVTKQAKVKDAVLASEISGLPDFDEGDGLTGFVCRRLSSEQASVVQKLHYSKDFIGCLKNVSNDPGFVEWDDNEMEFKY
jgi:hypothetical protein